jgi:hypothetical protein
MIDDFNPPKKPKQQSKPELLTGFRPSSNLPEHSGDDLMPKSQTPEPAPTAPISEPQTTTTNTEDLSMPIVVKKSKKKKILIILLILLLVIGAGASAWYFGIRDIGKTSTNATVVVEEETVEEVEEAPKTAASPLSGVEVAPELASRPVTAIMIENSGEARPQSGLYEAELVFEAIAEGGVTRYLALFQAAQPQIIGPIRSARPYYVEWAATYDASYVHAGGSPDGLQRIKDLDVKDVSAFSDSEVFYRTSDRFAPHNLYSSFKGIDSINQRNGFTTSEFTPWSRKKDLAQTPNATQISLAVSSDFYNVNYTYNALTNTYDRSLGGEPHVDETSGKTISPKIVIAMSMNRSQNGIYSVYTTTGSGQLIVFQDGRAIEGTWSRTGATDDYKLTDKYGFPIVLNKGQAWITVLSSINQATFN